MSNVDNSRDEDNSPYCEWKWSDKDLGKGVMLHENKLDVTFHPNKSHGCAAIRGTKVLAPNMEHYFEVELKGPFYGQARQVGIGTKHTALQSNSLDFYPLIGRDLCSWGVNYNGYKYHAGNKKWHLHVDTDKSDIVRIGVHYDSYYGALAFEVNGKCSGLAYKNVVATMEPYPMLCASAAGTKMRLVQSCSSVMSLRGLCRGVIRMQISNDEDYDKLILPAHLKSYLMYHNHKSKSASTNPSGSKKSNSSKHKKRNLTCQESNV